MSRRTTQIFSLSMLDLLTGALGAVIFLFIITPKGNKSPVVTQQAAIYFDTLQMKIHGVLPDSLLVNNPGDTLLVVMTDYKKLSDKKSPYTVLAKNELPSPKKTTRTKPAPSKYSPKKPAPKKENSETTKKPKVNKQISKKPDSKSKTTNKQSTKFKGSPPSVPAAVSFEINWADKEDNVDLIVCKNGNCVFGGRKRDKQIGNWDSGKSRNRLFGNDLRTNQEAVRQFDKIISGKYQIYAHFKESKKNNTKIKIKGLVYSKNKNSKERGENFIRNLSKTSNRVLIGIVELKADGTYKFIKK